MNITLEDRSFLIGYAVTRLTKEDREWAEDLVQTTLMKAFKAKGRYYEIGRLRGYLLRILTNEFINDYNKIKKGRKAHNTHMIVSQALMREAIEPPEPVDEFFEPEIQLTLDVMNQDQLEILLLVVKEKTYEEIAEELSIPVGTVMSRLWRARHFFKRESRIKSMEDYYDMFPEKGEKWAGRFIQNRAAKPHRFT